MAVNGHARRLAELEVVYRRRQLARRDCPDLAFLGALTPREQFELDRLLSVVDGDGLAPPRPWTPEESARVDQLAALARARWADGVDPKRLSCDELAELDGLLAAEHPLPGQGPARRLTLWARLRVEELFSKARPAGE